MPLNDIAYKADIKEALKETSWNSAIDKLSTAIDNYLKSGTVNTVLTCIFTSPPSTVTGSGVGTINVTQLSTLKTALLSAFEKETWDDCSSSVCNALNSYLGSAKANMVDTPTGSNTSTSISTTAGIAALTIGITNALKSEKWEDAVESNFTDLFKDATKSFITSCSVSTADSGTGWTGNSTSGSIS
jgi:hypothetical protein